MLPTRGVPLPPKGGVPLAAMGLRFKTEPHGALLRTNFANCGTLPVGRT
jgi:hypothetical protein